MSNNKNNTGNWNTGYRNTGNRNTGNWNTGDLNTGDCNTGYCNTGDWNTGYWNTGYWNTGNWNTGNWNTCDKETGFFNTIQSEKIRVFNNECSVIDWEKSQKPNFIYFNLAEWINPCDMSDKEKEENNSHTTTGGYLKVYEYKEAFQKSWSEADEEDRKKIFNLPNFDAVVFKEISGIDVYEDDEKNKKIKELEEKAKYIAEELNKLKK